MTPGAQEESVSPAWLATSIMNAHNSAHMHLYVHVYCITGIVSLYDICDDYNFNITHFPFLKSNVPFSPAYDVFFFLCKEVYLQILKSCDHLLAWMFMRVRRFDP